MISFNKWVGKDGKIRIYVNGIGYGLTAYVVDGGETGHYESGFPEVVVRAKNGRLVGQAEVDRIVDEIDEFVESRRTVPTPWRAPRWEDYLAVANG